MVNGLIGLNNSGKAAPAGAPSALEEQAEQTTKPQAPTSVPRTYSGPSGNEQEASQGEALLGSAGVPLPRRKGETKPATASLTGAFDPATGSAVRLNDSSSSAPRPRSTPRDVGTPPTQSQPPSDAAEPKPDYAPSTQSTKLPKFDDFERFRDLSQPLQDLLRARANGASAAVVTLLEKLVQNWHFWCLATAKWGEPSIAEALIEAVASGRMKSIDTRVLKVAVEVVREPELFKDFLDAIANVQDASNEFLLTALLGLQKYQALPEEKRHFILLGTCFLQPPARQQALEQEATAKELFRLVGELRPTLKHGREAILRAAERKAAYRATLEHLRTVVISSRFESLKSAEDRESALRLAIIAGPPSAFSAVHVWFAKGALQKLISDQGGANIESSYLHDLCNPYGSIASLGRRIDGLDANTKSRLIESLRKTSLADTLIAYARSNAGFDRATDQRLCRLAKTAWFQKMRTQGDRLRAVALVVATSRRAVEGNAVSRTIFGNTLDRVLSPTGRYTVEFEQMSRETMQGGTDGSTIFLHLDRSPETLARTLVHEVNHCVNMGIEDAGQSGPLHVLKIEVGAWFVEMTADKGRLPTLQEFYERCRTILKTYSYVSNALHETTPSGKPTAEAAKLIRYMSQFFPPPPFDVNDPASANKVVRRDHLVPANLSLRPDSPSLLPTGRNMDNHGSLRKPPTPNPPPRGKRRRKA